MSLDADDSNYRESLYVTEKYEKSQELLELHRQGYHIVNIGFIDRMQFVTSVNFIGEGDIIESMVASKKDIYIRRLHKAPMANRRNYLINAYSTVQEIIYFNQSDRFILEEKPLVAKKRKKKLQQKILRSHERPKYTILKPHDIRKRMRLPKVHIDKKSPIAHERRRHSRWLSNKKYAFDKDGKPREGKIIPYGRRKGEIYYLHVDVPATWIGPSENIVGNKHYKVLVNK
jgi:hypothetical protein